MTRKDCRYDCGRKVENETTTRCRTCRRADKKSGRPVRHDIRPGGPKILLLDIETSLQLSYHFGNWNVNINPALTIKPTRMLCIAAKWLGDPEVMFFSEPKDGGLDMAKAAWKLLDEADAVVHYYGSRFDIPHLNREFLEHGLTPPSPFKQIDLKLAVSKRFKFPSNKLQFVSQALGLSGKESHEGISLWRKCDEGDAEAWASMETYNRRDVTLLEEVYEHLLPWIPGLPHRHLYTDAGECPACGADKVKQAGMYRTPLSVFQAYTCGACGWQGRDSKRLYGATIQAAAIS